MAVEIQYSVKPFFKKLNLHYKNRCRLGISGYSQIFFYSFLFCYPSYSYAGPTGDNIVGGLGEVTRSGVTTNIDQFSSSLAIDWQSFNVSSNEIVNFNQPTSSSIVLNNILSTSGSEIRGQINANGQVVLVNPNGIFFGPTASVNVGGLIASGLKINTSDFMNGDYIFNEVLGTDGVVINSGLINASLGGNVALLGKQVSNIGDKGVITANLGTVNLAAGKAAVLTFDNQGLLGVQVTKAILQDELGIDPAVLNSGEINAESGRVLLTASVSQDVFSQAVNSDGIEQATSVVVNKDGTFTLGAGANVVNTGEIDVSAIDNDAGKINLLGENVTSSGVISANSENSSAGEIELHATDTTLLTENGSITAISEKNATGGVVKVLGNHVGLLDQSTINVSGALGGGQALVGGDFQGKNKFIRNANKTFFSEKSELYADGFASGDGGKVIVWADDTTRYYGNIFARGGANSGDGGFAEVSGKEFLDYRGYTNLTSVNGTKGQLLLDPKNITISTSNTSNGWSLPDDFNNFSDGNNGSNPTLNNSDLVTALNGADVILQANTDIDINADVVVTTGNSSLTLNAGRSINIDTGVRIELNAGTDAVKGSFTATINDNGAEKSNRDSGQAEFFMGTNSIIVMNGGAIDISTGVLDKDNDGNVNGTEVGDIYIGTLDTSGKDATSTVTINNQVGSVLLYNELAVTTPTITTQASDITITGNTVIKGTNETITLTTGADVGDIIFNSFVSSSADDSNSLVLDAGSGDVIFNNDIGSSTTDNLGMLKVSNANEVSLQRVRTGYVSATNNGIDLTATTINLNNNIRSSDDATKGNISLTGNVLLHDTLTIRTEGGNVTVNGPVNADVNALNKALRIIAGSTGNVTFDDAIGTATDGRLDGFQIDSANDIKLGTTGTANGGLTADTVTVVGSNSFTNYEFAINTAGIDGVSGTARTAGGAVNITSDTTLNVGSIDSRGGDTFSTANTVGAVGGLINLNAAVISVGDINTTGGNADGAGNAGGAGGEVTLTALANAGLESVTVTGDIDKRAGLDGDGVTRALSSAASIVLEADAGSVSGSVHLEKIGNYTSAINITGTADNEAVYRSNNLANTTAWDIDALNGGNINTSNIIFTSIESLIGGEGVDDFVFNANNSGDITGLIDGGTHSSVTDTNDSINFALSANNVAVKTDSLLTNTNLVSNSYIDTANIETLTGNSGQTNTIVGGDVANTWRIDATNSGGVSSTVDLTAAIPAANTQGVTKFTDFENLIGGTNTDNIIVENLGDLTGLIDGGSDGGSATTNDTLDLSLKSTDLSVQLGATLGTLTANVFDIDNIETLIGGSSNNTLSGNNTASTWRINSTDGGAFTSGAGLSASMPAGSIEGITKFTDFKHLTGGTAADNFIVENTGVITGLINGNSDGAAGNTNDTLDLSDKIVDVNIQLGASTSVLTPAAFNVANIETLSGGNANNFLLGSDLANTWRINGADQGAVTNGAGLDVSVPGITTEGITKFTGFNHLTGGTNSDNFIVENLGDITGLIDGGNDGAAGTTNDILNLSAKNANVSVQLGSTASTLTANAYDVDNIETLIGGSASNTLLGTNLANVWRIDTSNAGAVTSSGNLSTSIPVGNTEGITKFSAFENLTGGTNTDNFIVENLGDITGLIDGGSDGAAGNTNDILDLSLKSTAVSIKLGSSAATVNVYDIDNIETLLGGAASNTLIGADIANTWIINDGNTGAIGGATQLASGVPVGNVEGVTKYTDFSIFNGGSAIDTFNINGVNVTASINGGGDIDELIGHDVTNTWSIKAANSTLTSLNTVTFNAIENVTGGSLVDSFTFDLGGVITGLIDGGNNAGVTDTLNVANISGVTVSLDAANTTANVRINNIEEVTGSAVGVNTLLATDTANKWIINSQSSGAVGERAVFTQDTVPISGTQGLTKFTNFSTLTGGSAADEFIITTPNIAVAMTLNGGSSSNIASYDTLALGNTATPFTAASVWTIDDTDSGTLVSPTILAPTLTVNFNGIENLSGGTSDDAFNFEQPATIGSLRGLIDGGANSSVSPGDTISYTGLTNAIALEFINNSTEATNTSADQIYVKNIETIGGNAGSSFTGGTGTNDWFIETSNSGYVINSGQRINYTNIDTLIGNINEDNFEIVNDIDFIGSLSGGSGTDTLTAFATAKLGGNVWSDIVSSGTGLDGNLNTTAAFTGMETLYGNATNDTFNVISSNLNGSIYGFNPVNPSVDTGFDTINATVTTSNNVWDLTTNNNGNFNSNLSFVGMENLVGSSTTSDTINAVATNNTWNITANGTGSLESTTLGFSGMDVYNGTTGDDLFKLSASVTQGAFNGINPLLSGDVGTDTLSGGAVLTGNTWEVTQDFEGTLNVAIIFTGMDILNGNTTDDKFIISSNVNNGQLSGGFGNNTVELLTEVGTNLLTNIWNITAAGEGNVKAGVLFDSVTNLVGNDGVDQFNLNTQLFEGDINGGDNSDFLISSTGDNAWSITSANKGTVTDELLTVVSFDFIENLTGNKQDDTFKFENNTSSISGIIDGGNLLVGESDNDQVDLSAMSGALDVILGTDFLNIEKFIGNDHADSKFTALNLDNQWRIFNLLDPTVANPTIVVTNQGTVTDSNGAVVAFEGFKNITGGDLIDIFQIESNGNITGTIDGGNSNDQLDLSKLAIVDRTVGQAIGSNFLSVETIRGNGTNSILRADNSGSDWNINSNNTGSVTTTSGSSTSFIDFNILQGGDGVDVFTITTNGSIGNQIIGINDSVSRINGGAGDDDLIVNISGSTPLISGEYSQNISLFDGDGNVNVAAGVISFSNTDLAGTDSVTINGATASFDSANYSVNYTGQPITHSYSNTANATASSVSYVRIEDNVVDNVQANNLVINGSGSTNTVSLSASAGNAGNFIIEDGAVAGAGTTSFQVDYQNKGGISVKNMGAVGRIEIFGGLDFGTTGLIDLSAATINFQNTSDVISGDKLRLDSVTSINTSDAANRLQTNVATLELSNMLTDLFVEEVNGVALQQTDTAGLLDIISANGDITDLASLSNSAGLVLEATNGSIILDNSNTFSGEISLTTATAGTATLNNSGSDTALNKVSTGVLNIISGGEITDTATADITVNTATLNAGNSNVIFDHINNDFNIVTIDSSGLLQFNDVNSLTVATSNSATNTTFTVADDLIVNGALNSGTGVVLSANSGFIQLDGSVHTNTGDVLITGNQISQNALIDGAANITLTSATNIVQNADITGDGSGEIRLTANNGGITMANNTTSSNNIINYTALNAGNIAQATLANLNANNSITINADDGLTQTGAFTSTLGDIDITAGSYTMNTGTLVQASAGNVTAIIDGNVDAQSITAAGDISISSATQSVLLNNLISSSLGSVNVSADQSISAQQINSFTGIDLTTTNAGITLNANLVADQGIINVDSAQGISMGSNTSTVITNGDIQYSAVDDINVALLSSLKGDITVTTSSGELLDANDVSQNFIGNKLTIESFAGIGGNNIIETQVATMDIINTGAGNIDIRQTGAVDFNQLRNTVTGGEITIDSDGDYRFDPGSVAVDRTTGTLFMTTSGDFLGNGLADTSKPDITAFRASFIGSGVFGVIGRPLVLDVPVNGSVFIDTQTTSFLFSPEIPTDVTSNGVDVSALGVVSAIAGELLVEIESLGDIDPAIFTDLQNYSVEDISIRMPRDQLFEDEL